MCVIYTCYLTDISCVVLFMLGLDMTLPLFGIARPAGMYPLSQLPVPYYINSYIAIVSLPITSLLVLKRKQFVNICVYLQ